MKLFYNDTKPDFSKIHATSKGYGIQHPERIHGYAGAFLFTLLDVYLSDRLVRILDYNPGFTSTLQTIIKRFKNEDYGDLSYDEVSSNNEQRHISGSHRYMIARYETPIGKIIFESFFDMSLLYTEVEDITSTRNSQEMKPESRL